MKENDSAAIERTHRQQENAIAALLSAPTIRDAAKTCKISESTLLRWMKEDGFITSYRAARREVVTQAIAQIQSATGDAVNTLREIANDCEAPAASRVSAARAILDAAIRAVEVEDQDARIEALEAQYALLTQ